MYASKKEFVVMKSSLLRTTVILAVVLFAAAGLFLIGVKTAQTKIVKIEKIVKETVEVEKIVKETVVVKEIVEVEKIVKETVEVEKIVTPTPTLSNVDRVVPLIVIVDGRMLSDNEVATSGLSFHLMIADDLNREDDQVSSSLILFPATTIGIMLTVHPCKCTLDRARSSQISEEVFVSTDEIKTIVLIYNTQ